MNSHYNIFVGTENGLLKGVNSQAKTFNNLNNLESLSKDNEILAMCWLNEAEKQVIFGTRNQHLVKYDCDLSKAEQGPFTDLGEFQLGGAGLLKSMEFVQE